MLELNTTMLETVSGGWGSSYTKKITKITNTNVAFVNVSGNSIGSGFGLLNGSTGIVAIEVNQANVN